MLPEAAPASHTPFETGHRFVPPYYRGNGRSPRIHAEADVIDVAEHFDLGRHAHELVSRIIRAGKKPGEPLRKELDKVAEVLQRWRDEVVRAEAAAEGRP